MTSDVGRVFEAYRRVLRGRISVLSAPRCATGAAVFVLALGAVGCLAQPLPSLAPTRTPSTTPAITQTAPPTSPAVTLPTRPPLRTDFANVLPSELVGDWSQTSNQTTLSSAYTRRIFRFHPDGTYQYWNEYCQSYNTNCSGLAEFGFAAVTGDTIAFTPQSPQSEGARSYRFALGPDVTGTLHLQFFRGPGDVDTFYYGPP